MVGEVEAEGRQGQAQGVDPCSNGTIFNKQNLICDWWSNVDCSLAEELYSLNDQIAAEAATITSGGGGRGGRVGGGAQQGYSVGGVQTNKIIRNQENTMRH